MSFWRLIFITTLTILFSFRSFAYDPSEPETLHPDQGGAYSHCIDEIAYNNSLQQGDFRYATCSYTVSYCSIDNDIDYSIAGCGAYVPENYYGSQTYIHVHFFPIAQTCTTRPAEEPLGLTDPNTSQTTCYTGCAYASSGENDVWAPTGEVCTDSDSTPAPLPTTQSDKTLGCDPCQSGTPSDWAGD